MEYALIDKQGATLRYEHFEGEAPDLADAKGLNWLPVVEIRPEPVPAEGLSGPVVEVGVDAVTRTWTARPIADAKAERKAAATELRWEKETGGIVINGVPVATDDRSKTLILGKRAQAQSNPTMSFRWKAASGDWIDLTGAQIIAIADAVADHVQACFDREGELHDLIDAAKTAEDVLAVDITAGWP